MRRFILVGIVVFVVAGGVVSFLKYDQWFVFPAKRVFVAAAFVDPDSAKYRNERITRMGWLCGEVNAKNQNGGYVGYKRFVSGSSNDVYLEGAGYVGDNDSSTDQLIDTLKRKTKIIKDANAFFRSTGLKSGVSEANLISQINSQIFNENWKAHCAD